VIWAYLGPREAPPEFPEFDVDKIPEAERTVRFTFRECNWLQALEGDIDTVHVGFLHTGGAKPEQFEKGSLRYYGQKNRAPRYESIPTPYGAMYTAYRPAGEGELYHRVGQFVYPFFAMSPPDPMGTIGMRGWIPVDDHHTMAVQIHGRRPSVESLQRPQDKSAVPGAVLNFDYLPNTSDWYGRWRLKPSRANDYLLDRERQKTGNFTGIQGIYVQDQAVTESMGPIADRTHEQLGTSDRMIMLSRRQMLKAIAEFRNTGNAPPGVDDPELFRSVRAGYMIIPEDRDWLAEVNRYRKEWGGAQTPAIERAEPEPRARPRAPPRVPKRSRKDA
jgi:phthalate 4,5-dioxygenase oxygenase subunit